MMENDQGYTNPEHPTEEFISPAPEEGSSHDPLIGKKIGSCTIKRIIGSGGMGVVYEAIQDNPRRRVALKMMKRGVTSREATRRFEFESQTLARLKHQGVAQVYEAGTHDEGEGGVPYFIMEYVANAKPITKYAQEKKLSTRAKLKLFSKVCAAIQHGHLKGIVHRDLKPGNILVDSHGQPKIIDFGVARSTDSDLAVTTLQTDVGQLIGTLQYMSPEQCEADPSDIDIRSDVYALGVILYELLTGKPPYDIRRVAIHEAVRIVREQEPTKLSSVNKQLRGDIETIAQKSLEKDRDRRYQSATALQEDVEHYLNDEPITARPPGILDYFRRFAKKHTAAAIAIAAVFVVLVGAVIFVSSYAVKLEKQQTLLAKEKVLLATEKALLTKEITRSKSVKEFVATMLTHDWDDEMDKELMMHVLDEASVAVGTKFKNQPLVEAETRRIIGASYLEINKYAEAKEHFKEALFLFNKHSDLVRLNDTMVGVSLGSLSTMVQLGRVHFLLGDFPKAKELLTDAILLSKNALGENHHVGLKANSTMADLLNRQGKYNESEKHINVVLTSRRKTLGNNHIETISSLADLGVVYFGQGKYKEAEDCFREALTVRQKIHGKDHPDTLNTMLNLGNVLFTEKKYEEAKPILVEVLKTNRRILGNDNPAAVKVLNSLGALLKAQGQFAEAEPYLQEALEISTRVSGDSHPKTLWMTGALGDLFAAQGKLEEAEAIYAKSLETSRKVYGDENPSTVFLIGGVGELLLKQKKYAEAEITLLELIEIYARTLPSEHPNNYWAYETLVKIYEGWGKPEEAKRYRDMLPKQ